MSSTIYCACGWVGLCFLNLAFYATGSVANLFIFALSTPVATYYILSTLTEPKIAKKPINLYGDAE